MGKSFDDYPSMPHIDTDGIDIEDVINVAREKQLFRQMYRQMTQEQRKVTIEFIRVWLIIKTYCTDSKGICT